VERVALDDGDRLEVIGQHPGSKQTSDAGSENHCVFSQCRHIGSLRV
jgi:hypothetical protein